MSSANDTSSSSSDQQHNVRLSKSLSWLLRHNLVKEGLRPDRNGFVFVDDVLGIPRFRGFVQEQVEEVVRLNDKQRFALKDDERTGRRMIRANQGHSIQGIDPDLVAIADPAEFPQVIHGTYWKCWDSIRRKGLSRMTRNHIHFARGRPGEDGVVSGMRSGCNVLIYVDLEKAMADGFQFYESANKVILCPGNEAGFLPTQYFRKVVQRKKELAV